MDDETHSQTPLRLAIDKAFQALVGSQSTEGINPEIFANVINNITYFQKNLEPPANIYDFVQYAKYDMQYEVHPAGVVLMKDGEFSEKFYIVLKGNAHKIQVRGYEDIDREFKLRHPEERRGGASKQFAGLDDAPQKKFIPRYLQHTMATQKKTTTARLAHYFPSRLPTNEDIKLGDQKDISKSLSNIEGHKQDVSSLNELDWGVNQVLETSSKSEVKPQLRKSRNKQQAKGNTTTYLDSNFSEDEDSSAKLKRDEELRKKLAEEEDKEFVELLKNLAGKYPDINFFLCDVARMKKIRNYRPGDFFGENCLRENRKKENVYTVTSSEEVHVLTLSRDTYQTIMVQILERIKEKVNFFMDLFPSFEEEVIRKFSYNFYDRELKKNELIYSEGDLSQEMFVLRSGNVKLLKNIEQQSTHILAQPLSNFASGTPRRVEKVELPIASIIDHQFFGEELLLKEERRLFSAVAIASGTHAYFLEPRYYNMIKGNFVDLLKILKQQTKEKFEWRQQRVTDLTEQKKAMLSKVAITPRLMKSNSLVTASVMTPKSARNGDSQKLGHNVEDSYFKKEADQMQLHGLVLKTNRGFVLESPSMSKNSEFYKIKFARKAKNVERELSEERSFKVKDDVLKGDTSDIETLKFGLSKNPSEKKMPKFKLPMLNTQHSPAVSSRGQDSARNLLKGSEPNSARYHSLNKNANTPKSTVLDYYASEDMPNNPDFNKARVKEIVPSSFQSAIFSLARRNDERTAFIAPRDPRQAVEKEETPERVNLHTAKLTKKAGTNNRWRRKASEDSRIKNNNFTGVVGKRTEFNAKDFGKTIFYRE